MIWIIWGKYKVFAWLKLWFKDTICFWIVQTVRGYEKQNTQLYIVMYKAGCSYLNLLIFSILRRDRDSNPGYLAVQRFSRPPQSTTLPPLQNSFESCLVFQRRCKGRDYFLFCKQKRKKLFGHFMINQKRKIPKLEIVVLKIKNVRES